MEIWAIRRKGLRYYKDIVSNRNPNIMGLLTSVRSKRLTQYYDFLYLGVL